MASSGTKQVAYNRRAVYYMESIGIGGTSHNVIFEHQHIGAVSRRCFAHPSDKACLRNKCVYWGRIIIFGGIRSTELLRLVVSRVLTNTAAKFGDTEINTICCARSIGTYERPVSHTPDTRGFAVDLKTPIKKATARSYRS